MKSICEFDLLGERIPRQRGEHGEEKKSGGEEDSRRTEAKKMATKKECHRKICQTHAFGVY